MTEVVNCRECGARIVFLKSARDPTARVPVDADTVEPGDEVYTKGKHTSHFKTCTNPARFSKDRGRNA